MHHRAKFCEHWSHRSGDIADFRFSRWRPSAILDFQKLEISTPSPVRRPNVRHHAKFRGGRSNRSRDMADFRLFKMAAAAILDFGNFKFLMVGRSRGSNCVCAPNFVEIAQTAAEIWRFFDFSRSRPSAILDFLRVLGPPTKSIWWSL